MGVPFFRKFAENCFLGRLKTASKAQTLKKQGSGKGSVLGPVLGPVLDRFLMKNTSYLEGPRSPMALL